MKLPSRSIRPIIFCSIAAASALALAACDSKQENAREDAAEQKADKMENKADAVQENAETKADALESKKSMSNPKSTNAALDNQADATRAAAENKADALENKADAVRAQSPVPTP